MKDFKLKEKYMRIAMNLAKKGLGKTSPNPTVGAVLVKNGKIVGEGYHRRAGLPHAEVEALKAAGKHAKGAELFVTLEPCCFYGRTPPCTEAIIKAGIGKVYIGTIDPNPRVGGKSVEILRNKGILVEVGFLEKELKELNETYFKHITTGNPFVILKNALSLNGKIGFQGKRTFLTQEKAQRFVHRLRTQVDAIIVGINTVLADDPLLTPRLFGFGFPRKKWVRVILDSEGKIPLESKIVSTAVEVETWLATTKTILPRKAKLLEKAGVKVLQFSYDHNDKTKVSLSEVLKLMGKESITSVLVEGGGKVNSSFFQQNLWDKAVFIITPNLLLGDSLVDLIENFDQSSKKVFRLKPHKITKLGEDLALVFYPVDNSLQVKSNVYRFN